MKNFSSKGKFLTEIASVNPVLSKNTDFYCFYVRWIKLMHFYKNKNPREDKKPEKCKQ